MQCKYKYKGQLYSEEELRELLRQEGSKTRRILEIQSDLFQKGRERKNLVDFNKKRGTLTINHGNNNNYIVKDLQTEEVLLDTTNFEEAKKFKKDFEDNAEPRDSRENQFLQLLNKDNNWVGFFVKSIIQDSAKKGYEKVLFPTGDTAAKVEGHETLEDFKRIREKRIVQLKELLTPEGLEANWKEKLDTQERYLKSLKGRNVETTTLNSAPEGFYINPSITGTTKNFSRIRKNMSGVMPMDLVNDPNYTGWVLQNYTIGENNPVIKISDEKAQELLKEDNKLKISSHTQEIENQKDLIESIINGKNSIKDNTAAKAKNELEQFEKELKEAQEGTLKIGAIHTFYEKNIKNILDKRGYKPERIKDEHGNEWYQVKITPEQKQDIVLESSLSDLAEGLKNAAQTQDRFESQLERLVTEAARIQKNVVKIDDESLRTRMRDALRYVQDPQKKADLKNFAYFMFETSEVLKHYVTQLKKLPTIGTTDDQIALIEKAKVVSTNFGDLITYLKKDFRYVDDSNHFKQLVNELSNNYDQIQSIYAAEAEQITIAAMSEGLSKDAKIALNSLQNQIESLNKQLQRARDAGASEKFQNNLVKKINEVKHQINTLVPDAKNVEETIRGLRPDVNWFTANLRSTIAMGDPILSGYSRRLKEGFNKVRLALLPIRDEAQTQLENYTRALGVRPSQSMAKFYEGLYQLETETKENADGELESNEYYALLAPVRNKFYNDDLAFRTKIRNLKKAESDSAQINAAEKEYQDWLNKYSERKYAEAWYERYNLLTPAAAKARQDIIDEINDIIRNPNVDALSDDEIERLGELKYQRKRLGSLRDETGQLKTGEALEIAKSIQAFNKKTAEMSFWETTDENKKWFQIFLDKKKDQLDKGLITQDQYDHWFSANTQRNISQDFYKARQVIIDKIQSIASKLPKDQFKDDIKALWTSILDVSKPYRDEDNILDGSEFKPEESDVVRSSEEKIEELKAKLLRFSGLTMAEEQELQGLWASLDTLDTDEMDRLMSLKSQKEAYQAYLGKFVTPLELNQLFLAFGELAAISKWVPTQYYNSIYTQKLHEFRQSVDPAFLQDLKLITEKFKNESQWYKDNHITRTKKVFNEDSNQVSFIQEEEPLYIWKDIIPTNPNWIEENAPGFAFKTRIVKPEFINSAYSQLNYEYFKTSDPSEYRLIPKRFANENGTVGQSSYINNDYERLRKESQQNNQGKAKWDMLQYLIKTHLEGQQNLPKFKQLGYFLPGLIKTGYDKILERGVKGIKEDLVNKYSKLTQEDKDLTFGDTSQIELSVIPVKFSTKVKPEDQDLNLLEGILKHRASVEEYNYLESELPTANAIQSALRTAPKDVPQSLVDDVMKRLGFSRFIKGTKESQRSKTFEQFVRTMFYGEMQNTNFGNAKYNKWINNLFGLASLQVMTFNFPAHLTNLLSGEIQNIIETAGGKYMTWKDYLKAKAIYGANVHNFWNDYTKEGKKSFWSVLADRIDVPQGEFLDHFGRKTNFSRLRTMKSHVMLIKSGGEHEMQLSTMIAMALNRKVKMDGKLVSFNEALDFKDNKIVIRPGAEVTEEDIDDFQNKVQSVVRALNGAYSKIDRAVAEKSILGKMTFYLRKYLIPMIYRRYEGFKYDYEEKDFKEGYYRTAWHIVKDIVRLNTDIVKNWDIYTKSLTNEERVNMRRFFSEALIIAGLATAILLVGGYDKDRNLKGRWFYTMFLYQLEKMKSEAETFIPLPGLGWNEMSSLYSSPFVPAATIKNITRAGSDLASTVLNSKSAYFQRDYGVWSEGDLRLKADALKLIGINTNFISAENLVKNFELRNR